MNRSLLVGLMIAGWFAGPLAAQSDLIVVQFVDGQWRVVFDQMLWVS